MEGNNVTPVNNITKNTDNLVRVENNDVAAPTHLRLTLENKGMKRNWSN